MRAHITDLGSGRAESIAHAAKPLHDKAVRRRARRAALAEALERRRTTMTIAEALLRRTIRPGPPREVLADLQTWAGHTYGARLDLSRLDRAERRELDALLPRGSGGAVSFGRLDRVGRLRIDRLVAKADSTLNDRRKR